MKNMYKGLLIRPRENVKCPQYFVFFSSASEVKTWAEAKPIQEFTDGTQRVINPSRVRSITRFLKGDDKNWMPNAVLLSLPKGSFKILSKIDDIYVNAEISIKDEDKALIVDGQHRLEGACAFNSTLPLLFIALVDASVCEAAFNFIVINNKSSKVTADNVKAIISSHKDEEELGNRLRKSSILNSIQKNASYAHILDDLDSSPFHKMLNWPNNRARGARKVIELTAIETGIRIIRSSIISIKDDDDLIIDIYKEMWLVIMNSFKKSWSDDASIIFNKVVMDALTQFIADRIQYLKESELIDVYDLASINSSVKNILKKIDEKYFSSYDKEKEGLKDSPVFRNIISNDFKVMINNKDNSKDWSHGLGLYKK